MRVPIRTRRSTQELKWLANAANSPAQLRSFLRRNLRGEPLAYIIGTQPFGDLNLNVRPPVLIPRPETEEWTIKLSQLVSPNSSSRQLSVLDLGTGTGCIPLLLCHVWPKGAVRARGIDISPVAVDLANENAARCGFSPDNFKAIQANFLSPNFPENVPGLSPPFDIVTSNPPYIPWDEYLQLPKSVSRYEDPKALFGGPSGLEFYRAIAQLISRDGFLSPGATVALEIGYNQAAAVRELLHASGFNTEVWFDAWRKERTIIAQHARSRPSFGS
ncbi:protein-(glutamine-n5) release factor-specific [Moniliophthora roreri MCA 2997]|uniref:Protein-(Glutamine-n5) release factor-specific n=1 Tax=Moniliophthora roreri (strain MCA 2997) TaxID=1381753 RepID=V2XS37_MONRO|nr:protein-(glutamine-n5) release factor-specific [Moniliophthora roreri MCA 2997]